MKWPRVYPPALERKTAGFDASQKSNVVVERERQTQEGATNREVKTEVQEHRAGDAFERPLEPDEPKNDHQSDEDLSH